MPPYIFTTHFRAHVFGSGAVIEHWTTSDVTYLPSIEGKPQGVCIDVVGIEAAFRGGFITADDLASLGLLFWHLTVTAVHSTRSSM